MCNSTLEAFVSHVIIVMYHYRGLVATMTLSFASFYPASERHRAYGFPTLDRHDCLVVSERLAGRSRLQ